MTKFILKNPPKVSHIEISISTWAKDSHGLYDYEAATAESYKNQTFYVRQNCKLYRDNLKNELVANDSPTYKSNDAHLTFLGEISIDRSKATPEFKLKQSGRKEVEVINEFSQFFRGPYVVVRDYAIQGTAITNVPQNPVTSSGYALKPGNVIKLGRVEYMVIEVKNESQTFTLRDTNHFEETNGVFEVNEENSVPLTQSGTLPTQSAEMPIVQEINCKVCMCNEQTPTNRLISPCNCKGSCGIIHINCLQTWINSKVKKQIKGIASSYNFTKFQCQICKFPFPKIVRTMNDDIEMITISKPNKPYLLLESLTNKIQNKEERCLHMICTEENTPIKIGRGHQCEIRVTDISVSRKHAEITLKSGQFYISDTKAKFGTLIKLEEDIQLVPGKSTRIQCGRSVYELRVKGQPEEVDTE